MENTARLYNCVRCHCQVTICSHCDRGNIYCGKSCADLARRASLKAAGKRYQRTRRGRFKHAERQRYYRSKNKKVTHQASTKPSSNVPLITRSKAPVSLDVTEDYGIHCHFCGRLCSAFLRLGFRHRASPSMASDRQVKRQPPSFWGQAP